jgi:hypothetical protein
MHMQPDITAALAEQHRSDLAAQAGADRLARTARASRPSRAALPYRPAIAKTAKRAVAIVTTACVAWVFLALAPAGGHLFAAHLFAAHLFVAHVF